MPHTPRAPHWSLVGWLTWSAGKQVATGRTRGGSTVTNNHFATLHISHAFLGQRKSTGSQRRENLLHSEVRFDIRWWAASVGLVCARQTCHRFVSAHGTWSLHTLRRLIWFCSAYGKVRTATDLGRGGGERRINQSDWAKRGLHWQVAPSGGGWNSLQAWFARGTHVETR